jgi:hypothetical protein
VRFICHVQEIEYWSISTAGMSCVAVWVLPDISKIVVPSSLEPGVQEEYSWTFSNCLTLEHEGIKFHWNFSNCSLNITVSHPWHHESPAALLWVLCEVDTVCNLYDFLSLCSKYLWLYTVEQKFYSCEKCWGGGGGCWLLAWQEIFFGSEHPNHLWGSPSLLFDRTRC